MQRRSDTRLRTMHLARAASQRQALAQRLKRLLPGIPLRLVINAKP